MRWEEELFFRELKSHLHKRNNLLDAQTPETAAQEVIALLLAASILATQREAVAEEAGVTVRRISFAKVYHKVATLYEFVATAGEIGDRRIFNSLLKKDAQRPQRDSGNQAAAKPKLPPNATSARQRLAKNKKRVL